MLVFFVFRKSGLIRSCSSLKTYHKISLPYFVWRKLCVRLGSSNVRHFGMIAATALQLRRPGHLHCHDLPTVFHKIYKFVQKLIGGTDRHTDRMVISLTYIFPLRSKVGKTQATHYRLCCERQGGHVDFFINAKVSYTFAESFNKIQSVLPALQCFIYRHFQLDLPVYWASQDTYFLL
jgi:hypothetical protein